MSDFRICSHFDRRHFLSKILPTGAVACIASTSVYSFVQEATKPTAQKHIFLQESGMNYKEMFQFAYQSLYIPLIKQFIATEGKDKYLAVLQKVYTNMWSNRMIKVSRDIPEKNLKTFMESMVKVNNEAVGNLDPALLGRIMAHANIIQLIESTNNVLELNVTECLWANTYREVDAAEIGYITHCDSDHVLANAFDPNMKIYRTKTLMQGMECCNPRFVYEG